MKTEKIIVENLKCGGCINTIQNKLMSVEGVKKVSANKDNSEITIEADDEVSRETLCSKLKAAGYPEQGTDNNLITQIKSYGSCMIGKLSDSADE